MTTNEQVARACGWEFRISLYGWEQAKINGRWKHFNSLHDANDAVMAAEKFGLFELWGAIIGRRQHEGGRWYVEVPSVAGFPIAFSDTFCEAICNAIVALYDKTTN